MYNNYEKELIKVKCQLEFHGHQFQLFTKFVRRDIFSLTRFVSRDIFSLTRFVSRDKFSFTRFVRRDIFSFYEVCETRYIFSF